MILIKHCMVYFQSKTYDSVTDKFMDFSFEKVSCFHKFGVIKRMFDHSLTLLM